ncbi:MAG: adenylyltransferase/cytidyltransferase family protein [Coriobacteriia bacterium]|nr:adenylyltransferase/cytidyltransferase family protein [Coriobacteriia bacterium]
MREGKRRILTYGTFDLLHVGHVRLLQRAAALGDELIVGVSTDDFNSIKGKSAQYPYQDRAEIVAALTCVDEVIAEENWEQKADDIRRLDIDALVMGSDWEDDERFAHLCDLCELVFLPRTEGISTTSIKDDLSKGA